MDPSNRKLQFFWELPILFSALSTASIVKKFVFKFDEIFFFYNPQPLPLLLTPASPKKNDRLNSQVNVEMASHSNLRVSDVCQINT